MNQDFFIPNNSIPLTEKNIWRWYCNISKELEEDFLSENDKEFLTNYYYEAGLLNPWRRPFFRNHFARTFSHAVQHFSRLDQNPHIIDLGCGSGTQALLFSILGARVTGIDMDDKALSILNKRKAFYENLSGQALDLKTYACNAFNFNYKSIAPVHGIYSMFAFNLMKPPRVLLETITRYTADGCLLVILDGNNTSWLARLLPWRRREGCLSPLEMESFLDEKGFETVDHEAGIVIPPILWCLIPEKILRPIDSFLGKSWVMAVSHQIFAKKSI